MAKKQAHGTNGYGREANRWREPLTEGSFNSFFLPRRNVLDTFFRAGYLFDPFLFGSFWDPSEAFPLWDYTPYSIWPKQSVALSKSRLDWSQSQDDIAIRADLPGLKKNDIEVAVENGSVLKISGEWNKNDGESANGAEWWKVEYMRRLTLPPGINLAETKAEMEDGVLSIRIPRAIWKNGVGETSKEHKIPPTIEIVEVQDF